jgi:hypothetical protein
MMILSKKFILAVMWLGLLLCFLEISVSILLQEISYSEAFLCGSQFLQIFYGVVP